MKLRHLFFACSGVFVMMFSLLLLVVIVFSDEEDGGSGGNLIYGGVSVSQEVLAHKPMLEKYANGNQVTASLAVKYLDNQTMTTQVSQFDLVLEKNGENWKIVK